MSFILLEEQTAPATPGANRVLLYPKADGKMYSKDDLGNENAVSVGPASSTDNAVARYDGTSGNLQNSGVTIDDSNKLATVASVAGSAGVGIPHGTAPTTPVNGDVWTTTAGIFVRINGATVGPLGTLVNSATQAEQEAGSSTSVYVSPGRQQFHPSAAKAWVKFDNNINIEASYNIASLVDNGLGNWTVNWNTDFSSVNYNVQVSVNSLGGVAIGAHICSFNILSAGSTQIFNANSANAQVDTEGSGICVAAYGDQA